MDTTRFRKMLSICVAVFILAFAAPPARSQSTISVTLGPSESPVLVEFSPLPAKSHIREYQMLTTQFDLERTGEQILIMVLTMTNPTPIPVMTTLGDLVPWDGRKRHLYVAYLREKPATGRETYTLPNWDTTLEIRPENAVTLRLAFIVKQGEHATLEESLRIFVSFSHSAIDGVHHSVSRSKPVEPDTTRREATGEVRSSSYGVQVYQPPAEFLISDALNPVSVRQLSFPTTPMSRGGRSRSLTTLLGQQGADLELPYWFGIPLAIKDNFDYSTAMEFHDHVAEYLDRFPEKLARTTVWVKKQELLLVPTEHRVYFATSVWGVIAVPHEVAEVLLYVGEEALQLGINSTEVAPKPGTYEPIISPNPGEVTGFTIECTGVQIEANRVGNSYEVKIEGTDATGASLTKTLTYQRGF